MPATPPPTARPAVRPARPADDAEACRAIYATYVETTAVSLETEAPDRAEVQRRITAAVATHGWWVAEDAGRVVGYAYGGPHRSRPGYRFTTEVSVYVAPGHARRGLGRALYEPLLQQLTARGYRLALAGVTLPNPGSIALHEALGFDRVATFPAVGWKLGAWHDTGWWALALTPPDASGPPAEPR